MRALMVLTVVSLSGCGGGASPELYALVVDNFSLPDSCYSSGKQPDVVAVTQPPRFVQVQVWDGADDTAYLQVEEGGTAIDMGAAPSVTIGGLFSGKKGDKGWTFTSDEVKKNTLPSSDVITTTTHAEITFDRARTFRGSAALSSSLICVGNLCPGTKPACAVSGILVNGTKLAVQYERAP